MTEYPAPVADIMGAESVRAELAEAEARAEKLRAVLAVVEGEPAPMSAARPAAVRIHVSAVLRALGLNNRTEAALWWRENGGAVEAVMRDERRAA